jgi:structural protein gp24
MAFQSTVALQQGFGVAGELYTDAPHKAQSYRIVSSDYTNNIVGATAFTVTSEGLAQAGGTGVFAGILANPKAAPIQGTANGGYLQSSLILPNEAQADIVSMGDLIVILSGTAAIGDFVIYDNTSGTLATIAPGAALPVGKTFAQAKVSFFTVTAPGLAVITLNPTWVIPVLA